MDVSQSDTFPGIPEDEAVFYEDASRKQVEQLARLNSMEDLAKVTGSVSFKGLARIVSTRQRGEFPNPKDLWLAATFEIVGEKESFDFLRPIQGKTVLQLGGRGDDAIKFMLAGAKSAYLVSPVGAELQCGREVARLCGVDLNCRIGLAERIPFPDETFDFVYSSGCAHHFDTDKAFPEIARVLRKGGRFASIDPWRAPGYTLGIRVFGKREPEVHCRPLTAERVACLNRSFGGSRIKLHGTLTRYPLIAFAKLGLAAPPMVSWWITRFDDALCSLLHLRSFGSCVAILAEK